MPDSDQRQPDITLLKRVLLVEGSDDQMVVKRFCEQQGFNDTFDIYQCQGYRSLRKILLSSLTFEDDEKRKERIGVIVDADDDIAARWQSLGDVLRRKGYHPPRRIQSEGIVLEAEGRARVGIWIMPDNTVPGNLENFVAFLIQPDDMVWTYGLTCMTNLPERRFRDVDESKAQIYTWLAWQEEPGIQMSQAIYSRLLSAETDTTRNFVQWLRRVFSD